MFIASRSEDWSIRHYISHVAENIEQMERWVRDYAEGEEDGTTFYVYKVESAPVMKYTVVREVRGDAWGGTAQS